MRIFSGVFLLTVSLMTARAGLITFEDLPDANLTAVGGMNIGSFYAAQGITFGPDVTGIRSTDLLNPLAFPMHGNVAGFTTSGGNSCAFDASRLCITMTFSSAETDVSLIYASTDKITLAAYDATNTQLKSVDGSANTNGTDPGTDSTLSLSAAGIMSLQLSGPAGSYIFDDLSFTAAGGPPPAAVPEPGAVVLLGVALLAMSSFRALRIQP